MASRSSRRPTSVSGRRTVTRASTDGRAGRDLGGERCRLEGEQVLAPGRVPAPPSTSASVGSALTLEAAVRERSNAESSRRRRSRPPDSEQREHRPGPDRRQTSRGAADRARPPGGSPGRTVGPVGGRDGRRGRSLGHRIIGQVAVESRVAGRPRDVPGPGRRSARQTPPKSYPPSAASVGKRLIGVKPGMVLISDRYDALAGDAGSRSGRSPPPRSPGRHRARACAGSRAGPPASPRPGWSSRTARRCTWRRSRRTRGPTDDLAGTEHLQPRRVVADDRDLEVASARRGRLDQGEVVVAEGELEGRAPVRRRRGPASSRPSCPSRAGLTIRRGSAAPAAKAISSRSGRPARPRPALGANLAPVDDRQPEPAAHPLEEGLVHAQRGRRDARPGVGAGRPPRGAPGRCRPRRTGRAGR